MKLSDYAKAKGVRYETAWKWFHDGQIKGRRFGRTIIVEDEEIQGQKSLSGLRSCGRATLNGEGLSIRAQFGAFP